MRLIDADALERNITLIYLETCHEGLTPPQIDLIAKFSAKALSEITHAPTIEAEPVRKGSYKVIYDPFMMRHKFECMECGHTFYIGNAGLEFDYCPKCGIKITRAETINAWTGEPETEDE